MEILTHVIAAEEDALVQVGESTSPLDDWSGVSAPGWDTAKFAMLHCLLTEDTLQTALDRCQPVYVSENEIIVLRVSDQVQEKLAAFDAPALECVAVELAASDEFEKAHWRVEDVLSVLTEVAELAQLAESQGQVLFVGMCVVR
jgi:hypothetical protein